MVQQGLYAADRCGWMGRDSRLGQETPWELCSQAGGEALPCGLRVGKPHEEGRAAPGRAMRLCGARRASVSLQRGLNGPNIPVLKL